MEKTINKNKKYWIKMNPLQSLGPITFKDNNESESRFVLCTIDESRYKVEDGYKVELRSIDPAFGSEVYYQSDFIQSLRDGFIKEDDGNIKPNKFVERTMITNSVYVETTGYELK